MNTDTVKGDWKQMKGKLKQKWAKLTDDDVQFIEGKQEEASGILQKRYGLAKDEAEKQWKEFCDSCSC